jgi:hypothetical protein
MSINFCSFDGNEEISRANLATIMVSRVEGEFGIRRSGTLYGNLIRIALHYVVEGEHDLISSASLLFL